MPVSDTKFIYSIENGSRFIIKGRAKKNIHDSVRCRILSNLAEQASDAEWPQFNEQLITLSQEKLAENTSDSNRYRSFLALAINNKGYLLRQKGNNAEAVKLYKEAAALREKAGDLKGLSESLNNIGFVFKTQGNISRAVEYYSRSLQLQEKIGDKDGMAISLNNLGSIYFNYINVQKALEYSEKALTLYEETGNEKDKASILGNVGFNYLMLNQLEKALNYCQQALALMQKAQHKKESGAVLETIGMIWEGKNNNGKALEFFSESLKIREECSDSKGLTSVHLSIARLYYNEKNYTLAIHHANKSLEIARSIGYPENIMNTSNLLYNIYRIKKDHKMAYRYYTVRSAMSDSIYSNENRNAGIRTQLRYEFERQLSADSVKHNEEKKVSGALLAAQRAKLEQEKTQFWFLFDGFAVIAAGLLFVIKRFRITRKQKSIIENQKLQMDEAYIRLEEQNKNVIASITYARRIQKAIITNERYISRTLQRIKNK